MSSSEHEELEEDRNALGLTSLPPTPDSRPQDDESVDSATEDRLKFQRGGRKKTTSRRQSRKSRIGDLPESKTKSEDELYDAAEAALVQDLPDEPIGESAVDDPEEDYYEEEEEEEEQEGPKHEPPSQTVHRDPVLPPSPSKDKNLCDNCSAKTKKPKSTTPPPVSAIPSPFETGIKAFNLKRADASGGRPVGISTSNQDSSKKSSKKTAKKTKKKKKKVVESESEEESGEDDEAPPKQKPFSIRLDLNLMVEIFLKAKIKGDVTITFLE